MKSKTKADFCVKYVGINPRILSKSTDGTYLVEYEYEQFTVNMPNKKATNYMILDDSTVKAISEQYV